MTSQFNDIMIAEGVEEADEQERIEAFQRLISSGVVWQLQGSFGRTAKRLIELGLCHQPARI